MADLSVNFKRISDESTVDNTGTVTKVRRYDFFIGTHGPFTERVPLENFSDAEITNRVNRIKAHLSALPK